MSDLFAREQKILNDAVAHTDEMRGRVLNDSYKYETLAREYGRLLRQIRRAAKNSEKVNGDLGNVKAEPIDESQCDSLTGAFGRSFFNNTMERYIKALSRSYGVISVMMVDIDYFKLYNEHYGSDAGDVCLKSVAEAVKSCLLRVDDFVARCSGEEFIVVLPHSNEIGAELIAKRILEKISELAILHEKSEVASTLTVSIGIVTANAEHTQSAMEYLMSTEKALLKAKTSGRNRFVFGELLEEALIG